MMTMVQFADLNQLVVLAMKPTKAMVIAILLIPVVSPVEMKKKITNTTNRLVFDLATLTRIFNDTCHFAKLK